VTRTPESATPLVGGQIETTPWAVALERLEHPAPGQNHWLATVAPDGRPHLMPIIAFWIDGAFHFLAGEGNRKGRNLAADDRCVIGTGNLTMPSLDLIVEGRAKPVTDEAEVRRLAAEFGGEGWVASGSGQPRLRSAWPDRWAAAVRDLSARADQGLRSAGHARHVRHRRVAPADSLAVPRRLTR
jgi:hypothetical protein